MFLRNTLIASATVLTALSGAAFTQKAIAMPTPSSDALLVSQAIPSSYTVEVVEVMDINSDGDTLWVRAMEDNTHMSLYNAPSSILSTVQNGDILYVLKSGSSIVDIAWSESEFGFAQIAMDADAARSEVQALYSSLSAGSEVQTLSMPARAQTSTAVSRPQPAPHVSRPIRGLW